MSFFPPITPEAAAANLRALSERFARKPDGLVYHYTNLASLAGILDSQAIHCSDYRQLNDRSEFHFGMNILESLVANRAPQLGLSQERTLKMLGHLADLRQGNFHLSIFCASWCLWPNDLTLWRAYAAQDGVCIGFSRGELTKLAEHLGFACGPVRYYDAPQFREWFDLQLRELCDGLDRMDQNEDRIRAEVQNPHEHFDLMLGAQRHDHTDRWIGEVSSIVKRPDFAGEQEWRCVYVRGENPMRRQPAIKIRTSGTRAVPYIELPIEKGDSLIRRVVIGPSSRAQENFEAAGRLGRGWGFEVKLPDHAFVDKGTVA